MPLDPQLPKQLLHLVEKRNQPDRRKQRGANGANEAAHNGGRALPSGTERRQAQRRKPNRSKRGKA